MPLDFASQNKMVQEGFGGKGGENFGVEGGPFSLLTAKGLGDSTSDLPFPDSGGTLHGSLSLTPEVDGLRTARHYL